MTGKKKETSHELLRPVSNSTAGDIQLAYSRIPMICMVGIEEPTYIHAIHILLK